MAKAETVFIYIGIYPSWAALKAEKQVAKDLDVKPKDIDKAIRQAAGELS